GLAWHAGPRLVGRRPRAPGRPSGASLRWACRGHAPALQPPACPRESGPVWNPAIEQLPRPELEALQLARLRWSVGHARAANAIYRERFAQAGVDEARLKSLDDLRRLPFTVKADLREHYPFGLFAAPLGQVVRIHASSGTRGKPTLVGYTRHDLAVWSEVMARCLAHCGAGPGT